MQETSAHDAKAEEIGIQHERLGSIRMCFEVLYGVGIMLGLALLWMLEIIRNVFFRLLDRLNLKPRRSTRASAFPPGKPQRGSQTA